MRTIWLASYPKSGNTWFRMLVANLSAEDGRPVDINNLPEDHGIASSRGMFDHYTLVDTGLLTHDEIDCLRPRLHEELARVAQNPEAGKLGHAPPVRFVKVHDAYTLTPKGEPLLAGARGADGAVVIVRDPRDVAPSLANHLGKSIDGAITIMNDAAAKYSAPPGRQAAQLRQTLGSWSEHVESWLDQTDIPVHLVRYEDMQGDAVGTFAEVLNFAGYPASVERIAQAAALATFSELARQEREKGFKEASRADGGRKFFRRGQAGTWRDELTPEQIARIEAVHASMMRRLGYELSCAPARARIGEVA